MAKCGELLLLHKIVLILKQPSTTKRQTPLLQALHSLAEEQHSTQVGEG